MTAKRGRNENPIVYLDVKIGERSAGRLIIELRADVVPKAAENFRRLCTGETKNPWTGRRRQYIHCPFHRVVRGKFCQSGDFVNHDGSGGESTFDQPTDTEEAGQSPRKDLELASANQDIAAYSVASMPTTFLDENFILRHTGAGVLSMVNTGPDSNTSQFYLHFAANPHLDDQHVVFGCLLGEESFDVLDQIQAVATERGDPKLSVKIAACGQFDTTITQ